MSYKIGSRDYLSRARERLDENKPESLFYAALELRFGIEARLKKYLDANIELSKKKKNGWQIAVLGKNVENVFKQSNKLVRFKIYDEHQKKELGELLYTPVSKKLIKDGEKIGKLLHSNRHFETQDLDWSSKTKDFLEAVYRELELANKGTLLGPPLYSPRLDKVDLNIEFYEGYNPRAMSDEAGGVGAKIIIEISYPDSL